MAQRYLVDRRLGRAASSRSPPCTPTAVAGPKGPQRPWGRRRRPQQGCNARGDCEWPLRVTNAAAIIVGGVIIGGYGAPCTAAAAPR